MKISRIPFFAFLLSGLFFVGCDDDEITIPTDETTSFEITLTNTINLLSSTVFNTPDGSTAPAPIAQEGGSYTINFAAQPGARLNFVSMLANSNDWFFAIGQDGIALFDDTGNPLTGDITNNIRLYDAGTEEEDSATIATEPDGGTNGVADDDTSVRTQEEDVSPYLSADLAYSNGSFTLKITKGAEGVITPGLVVTHAQGEALFTRGEAERNNGLKLLAEAGNPVELYDFINELGPDGAPLRLSAGISPLSPAVVYAFNADNDPLFTQGEAISNANGLEELAEDGNNSIIFDYLESLELPVAKSNEAGGVGPGQSLTFNIDVPKGYKLGLATMLVQSNDWFIAFNNNGGSLFDTNGNPLRGETESSQLYLFDSGTEADELLGLGNDQAPRQTGPGVGTADSDTNVRRVSSIEDTAFGKGIISSGAGVVASGDARGGYNFVKVDIQTQ